MNTTNKIIDYLFTQSRGVINITPQHAEAIIDLVVYQYARDIKAVAKLYRHNAVIDTWELIRTVHTTDEIIKEQIIIALEKKPPENFLMFECYNQAGQFEGRIYTINPSLF